MSNFTDSFWNAKIDIKDLPTTVRINGEHYQIGKEEVCGFRGFSGREFHIHFTDGRQDAHVITTNLWYQGKIPAEYTEILPDNAEFLKVEE